ncbi:MAG: HYR domain-containing protein [Flavobacteriales bacterium]|nr:HYR domain-containing protein [Flavobacteriales bacterium]
MNAASNACSATVTWSPPTMSDNCVGGSMAQTGGQAPGSAFAVGTHTISYTALDAANNAATCSFSITVSDATAPVISCPSDIAVNAAAVGCSAVVNYNVPTFSDNCAGATMVRISGPASGSSFPVGTTLVSHRVTAANGMEAECTFWVTVFDAEAPVLAGCADVAANSAAGLCTAVVNYPTPTSSDNCANCSPAAPVGATFIGTYDGRSFYLSANALPWGPANSAAIADGGHLVVVENAAMNAWLRNAVTTSAGSPIPYWIGLNDAGTEGNYRWTNAISATYLNWGAPAPNNGGPTGNEDYVEVGGTGSWNDLANTATLRYVIEVESPCITPVLVTGQLSGTSFPVGTTPVKYMSTDAAGNSSTCSFDVVVSDAQDPIVTCPGSIPPSTPRAHAWPPCHWLSLVTTTDNCGIAPGSLVQNPAPGASVGGTFTVTFTVTDVNGRTGNCSIIASVTDNVPPAFLTCPSNKVRNDSDGDCAENVSWATPTTSDNCSAVSLVRTGPASNSAFPIGTTTITYTATDASGNSSICSFTVTVNDNAAPSVSCPLYDYYPIYLNGSCNLPFPDMRDSISVSDCSAWTNVMDPPAGYVFTRDTTFFMTMDIDDVHGHHVDNDHWIHIVDDTPPAFTPQPDVILAMDGTGNITIPDLLPNYAGATDCTTPITKSQDVAPGTQASVPTLVKIFLVDAVNNSSIDSVMVIPFDNMPPVLTCPADITISASPGACNAAVSFTATATDNTGAAPAVTYSPSSGSAFGLGTTTVTVTAQDAALNQSTCTFTVTVSPAVVDIAYPVATVCNSSASILPSTVIPAISGGGVFSDASQSSPSTIDPVTGEFNPAVAAPGLHTIQYVFTGACTSQDVFTIDVVDAPNAGSNGSLATCSNGPVQSLFAQLGGSPSAVGTWSGPSTVTAGNHDPATMDPGVYIYTVAGSAPCPDATATVTVSEVAAPSAGTNGTLTVCSNSSNQSLLAFLGGFPASGGTWSGPSPVIANTYAPATMDPGVYTYTVAGNAPCASAIATVTVTENAAITYYADQDSDGFGDPATSVFVCAAPMGYVLNNTDLCPFDVNKVLPGQCGCGNADTDNDDDGTANCLDDCPNDPNKVTPGICGCGVSELDSDGDGMADCIDNCPTLFGQIGSPCDDGLATTGNDVIDASCTCVGQLIDCTGVPGGSNLIGTACDDGNAATGNDTWDASCTCVGQLIDCEGTAGGTALIGPCDDQRRDRQRHRDATAGAVDPHRHRAMTATLQGNDTWDATAPAWDNSSIVREPLVVLR